MKMREGRLRWYGHVMRRDQDYIGRRVMKMELLGNRNRGRPKRRFLDVVKEDMEKLVWREKDIGDRMLWRSIICCGNPRLKGKAERRSFQTIVFEQLFRNGDCNVKLLNKIAKQKKLT